MTSVRFQISDFFLALTLFLFFFEERAATFWRAAPTGRFGFEFFCAGRVDHESIIVKEFFARADIAQGMDEDALTMIFARFAVRIAGMIDEARFISADRGVDHLFLIIEPEIISALVVDLFRDARPENASPGVFNNARTFADRLRGKNAAAVNARSPDRQSGGRGVEMFAS